ncbi:HMG (high mobility group) box domain-containing protein [Toxoplasma gondii VEG]|uniref:HMG (High mobility group) box domain-containing protein n=3 Tax=Toxoplasma gondii TaxID=5811 RepID=V4ZHJ8_TOXGV|nr:HMG (high mobility group) box domain-containing protein [Toxoplasma gondii VEG]
MKRTFQLSETHLSLQLVFVFKRKCTAEHLHVGFEISSSVVGLSSVKKMAKDAAAGEEKKRRNGRKKKDPNAPRRALSAFMFFAKEKRTEIVAANPELKSQMTKVGKMVGEAWGKLTPEERKPFEEKAAQDKARYLSEKQEFEQKQ